jgi:hypothetical protein
MSIADAIIKDVQALSESKRSKNYKGSFAFFNWRTFCGSD